METPKGHFFSLEHRASKHSKKHRVFLTLNKQDRASILLSAPTAKTVAQTIMNQYFPNQQMK